MLVGFSPVMFLAPWLQVEQRARRFDSSIFPPRLLSLMCPRWSRTLRPVAGSISPGVRPHIWQVNPLRSKTSARSLAEMPRSNLMGFSGGSSVSTYCPGFRQVTSWCVTIFQPSCSRSTELFSVVRTGPPEGRFKINPPREALVGLVNVTPVHQIGEQVPECRFRVNL